MRSLFAVLLAAGALSLANGCGKKDTAKGGYPTPEGTYLITSVEAEGEPLPEEFFSKAPEPERTIRFSGNKMTATKGGKDDVIDVAYDTSKSPAHLTTTEKKPSGQTEKTYGIYKIEGDTLTICVTKGRESKEEDRPKEFKTAKGGKEFLMTLKKK
jgi:uncharacterized protein (TIGR03067 family)